MAKFYGSIGFSVETETSPGVWSNGPVVKEYYGDVIRNTRRLQTADKLNDDISISNEISILADPFANENFLSILYVEYMGVKWKISNVEVQYPRLILTLGGVYNGQ